MDAYDVIEMNPYCIELDKFICTICHLQYDSKQDVTVAVETDKQLYLFYYIPYQ